MELLVHHCQSCSISKLTGSNSINPGVRVLLSEGLRKVSLVDRAKIKWEELLFGVWVGVYARSCGSGGGKQTQTALKV